MKALSMEASGIRHCLNSLTCIVFSTIVSKSKCIMLAISESKSFFIAAIVTVIVLTFQTASSIGDKNVTRYRTFLTNNISSLTSRWNSEVRKQRDKLLAAIVDQILTRYLTREKLLYVIIGNGMEHDDFRDFLKMGSTSVITMGPDERNFEKPRAIYQKPTSYLFLGIDFSEMIESLINLTVYKSSWNPRALYITIAQSKEEAVSMMTRLRKQFVYKVIILIIHNDPLNAVIEAYTWRPYYPPGNCGPPTQKSLIRLGTLTESLVFKNETDIRPGMIPNNFGNCPLNISYNIWEPYVLPPEEEEGNQIVSLEVVLTELVCGTIGVKVNRVYYLSVPEVRKSEATAGGIIPSSEILKIFDVSIPYLQDSLGWIVPSKNKRRTLFSMNDGSLLIFGTLTAIAMCVATVSLMATGSRNWALAVWGSLWEQPLSEVPNKAKAIWCCWLLICLHLSTVYRTALVNNFANPFVENVIHDESDLLESGLELGFIAAAEVYFDKENDLDKKVLERHVRCKSVPECYKEIPTGKAVFTNKMLTQYLDGRKDVPNSLRETVRHVPPSLTYKLSMLYVKGHAMFLAFDKSMLAAIQAGFVEYWVKSVEVRQTSIIVQRSHFISENKYLTFGDVRRAFNMLGVGLAVAALSFLCELFYHSLSQPERQELSEEKK